jgi:formylglycine-generating enzyme required for sulfatase activity
MRVTLLDALRFAEWLGGQIPTAPQWDWAAGRFDEKAGLGPFVGESEDLIPGKDIALQGKPMDIGTAHRDQALTGCRDMAGNGREWTRTKWPEKRELPVDLSSYNPKQYVFVRGCSYRAKSPFLFREADIDSQMGGMAAPNIGFRVVIEIP